LELLRLLGDVVIPPAVQDEMTLLADGWTEESAAWIRREPLERPFRAAARHWNDAGVLHLGEAEAIALALQTQADWFLSDDAAAREFAKPLNLEIRGSLGVVLALVEERHLGHAEAETLLDRLERSTLWIHEAVMARARNALRQLASVSTIL
jgi:predicted nucleic acid-binding protein